jgi:PAS domain S-box-containing protein
MTHSLIDILFVASHSPTTTIIKNLFNQELDFNLTHMLNLAEAMAPAQPIPQPHVILLDIPYEVELALILITETEKFWPAVPIIGIGPLNDDKLDIAVVQAGAVDYLTHDNLNFYTISRTLRYAVERNKTAKLLRLQSAALEATANAILITDPKGLIQWINPAFTTLTGYTAQEAVGKTPGILKSGQHPAQFYSQMWNTLFSGQVWRGHITNRHKDGHSYTTAQTITPLISPQGKIVNFISIMQDITLRAAIDAELNKERLTLAQRVNERTVELRATNAKLSHALKTKDEFMASMSHELRTPLNAILGMSEVLKEEIYGPLNDKQLKSVEIMEESGRHLLALINDVLDVSKIEADKLELTLKTVSVETICQASLRFIQQTAKKKLLTITENYQHANVTFLADERRLKQILVNLLSNAVKFTPTGGEIGLDVLADSLTRQLDFTVWDSGIGIAPADMDKLFSPFVQLDSRLSREFEGSGLGLTLVQLLAQLHEGSVRVESEVGRGSRFIVSIPWKMGGPLPESPAAPPVRAVGPLHPSLETGTRQPLLLLAEDNMANVDVISSYLSAKGYKVITAKDGLEAVAYAKKMQPDLILMDIHLPGIDGLEATRRIRVEDNLAQVPIIALTALAMPGDIERCRAAGMNNYLSKPVSLRALTAAIETCLLPEAPK